MRFNLKERKKQAKGITLIALVITIVILLILAGIIIAQLSGENGLFKKTQLAKEKYEISEYKEKIQLEIENLKIDKNSKGEDLSKDDLQKINGDEIDVGSTEKFPVEVMGGKYKFNVDENFVVTYVGEADSTVITYTIEPKGYTNQNEIKILIKVKNPKGIKTIECPEGEPLSVNGATEKQIEYIVTNNGTYIFRVIDIENKEITKEIVINQIDTLKPLDFTPVIDEIKSTSFVITTNTEDEEADGISTKSGMDKYEYYINGVLKETTTNEYYKATELTRNTQYSIYVIAYDKAGNIKQSQTVTATTTSGDYPTLTLNGMINLDEPAGDAIKEVCYDKDITTYQQVMGPTLYFKIDPECWNKYISIYCETIDSDYHYGYLSLGSSYNSGDKVSGYLTDLSGLESIKLVTKSVLIPEGTYWGSVTSGTWGSEKFNVYEIWCSEENLTGKVY